MTDAKTAEEPHPTDVVLPDHRIADWKHELELPEDMSTPEKRAVAKANLLKRVEEGAMLPLYEELCEKFGWTKDEALVERLRKQNEEELSKLEAAIEDARENFGDVEVKDGLLRKANFFCCIGNNAKAKAAYLEAHSKTVGAGGRLDIRLTLIRLGLALGDIELVKENMLAAKEELEKGGDWERRNKLKVYEGVLLMVTRNFKDATTLLLDSLATFTATELLDFEEFVFYTVVLSMLTLERPVLKEKVVQSPEVLQVTCEDESLSKFLMSFYNCDYTGFMEALIPIAHRVHRDRYLRRHYLHYIRLARLRAYAQFLEPFKSVTVASMGHAFSVSPKFIEAEVSSFIASGRLSCKVDRVAGVIESNQLDPRNEMYRRTLKQGDQLLTRIQKLSRVIDM